MFLSGANGGGAGHGASRCRGRGRPSRGLRGGGAARARRAAGAGARQDALSLRPALDARADAGRDERAGEDGGAAADPRAEPVAGALDARRGGRDQRRERVRPAADGIDYGVCVPRDLQDVQLVEAAREQGAEVRERCTVEALRWRAGRVDGVRYRDADGAEREVASTLVVGADGRRSTVAALVGAWTPYRLSRNGRGLVFRYLEDPRGHVDAETYYQWREGNSFAFAFPNTPAGRLLVLLMGHRDEAGEARSDPEGYWQRKLASIPAWPRGWRARRPDRSCARPARRPPSSAPPRAPGGRSRATPGTSRTPSPARACATRCSPGARWPSRSCRSLDDPAAVDRATRSWEADRDRECLPAYHFANSDTRVERQSPGCASSCATPGARRSPTSATSSAAPARRSRSRPRPASRALWSRPCGGASDRAGNAGTRARGLRTEIEIRSELPARTASARPDRRGLRAPRRRLARSPGPRVPPNQGDRHRRAPHPPRRWRHDPDRRRPARARARGGRAEPRAVEDLIRDAHREHAAEVIVVPEAFTTPNVYAKVLRGTARPVDGQPLQLLTRLARELDCVLARRLPRRPRPSHLRDLRAGRARRRGAPARQGHPHRLGAALLRRRRRRRGGAVRRRSAAPSG